MRLVQITDCHLHADPAARGRIGVPLGQLEAVIAAVNREKPDRVVVSGDISQDETAASYALATRTLSKLEAPWAWLPGNHDSPELMVEHQSLPAELDLGDWRALLLDTRVPGREGGELGPQRLTALDARLAGDDRPTLLVMHHPPLSIGTAWLDAIGLADAEAFWRCLAPYGQVRAVCFGHVHQAFEGAQALAGRRVAVYGCPAASDQFLPGAATFALDEAARPGYRVLDLAPGGIETRVGRVAP
ncbi:3',5'-cyclic adenosine monophosphate phosphodiesterase CpdA [Halomonas sp. THAF5a]|uniref:metallophosphoesterase n=1 Tax=Halomonas sp. THAF5a TaxID=2587844 RepID=UPI001268F191|nr:metallophosphoesterase [Halomonas sp. THAF5a]QFU02588.1 3',5'-cyclic adenosine monophosphate phosphodiesterase CpdA [Halomonas sp. THAF5a]